MSVQRLANTIAKAVQEATSKRGMAELATVSDDIVITPHGAYGFDTCCPVNLYNGKTVWIQLTEQGNAVIIGE